jgi:hypothetical protein
MMRSLAASRQGPEQLQRMLEEALRKEEAWRPMVYKSSTKKDAEINSEQRNELVRWLAQLNQKFGFYPETLALSTAILDRFLHVVKAHPKYLRCIGIACLYLAAKTLEEDENIPGTLEFIRESLCGYTISEVLRMERCILNKLGWDLMSITALDFLYIFHATLMSKNPQLLDKLPHMTPSRQLALLTDKFQRCQAVDSMLQYRPATLAVALLSLEMELFSVDWLPMTLWLQVQIKGDNQNLIQCREEASRVLAGSGKSRLAFLYAALAKHQSMAKPTKRKMDDLSDTEDDFYDGIKRLYNEDGTDQVPVLPVNSTCGLEMHHEKAISAPPLQAVAN